MSEQGFLARCKAFMRSGRVADLGGIKLLHIVVIIAERLDAQDEDSAAFASADEPPHLNNGNERHAALFVADLRSADSNDTSPTRSRGSLRSCD